MVVHFVTKHSRVPLEGITRIGSIDPKKRVFSQKTNLGLKGGQQCHITSDCGSTPWVGMVVNSRQPNYVCVNRRDILDTATKDTTLGQWSHKLNVATHRVNQARASA